MIEWNLVQLVAQGILACASILSHQCIQEFTASKQIAYLPLPFHFMQYICKLLEKATRTSYVDTQLIVVNFTRIWYFILVM